MQKKNTQSLTVVFPELGKYIEVDMALRESRRQKQPASPVPGSRHALAFPSFKALLVGR